MKIVKKTLVSGVTGALVIGVSLAAFAQGGVKTEISTAHTHAMYAKDATSVAVAQVHMHHVINCLVGPKGSGYDAKQADPCKGQGDGALPDSASDNALHAKLESALADAQAGLKAESLAAVHQDADKAAAALQDGSTAKASSSSW